MTERKERCDTCKWWHESWFAGNQTSHRCKRHAPRPSTPNEVRVAIESQMELDGPFGAWCGTITLWPSTEPDDFCGEWQEAGRQNAFVSNAGHVTVDDVARQCPQEAAKRLLGELAKRVTYAKDVTRKDIDDAVRHFANDNYRMQERTIRNAVEQLRQAVS